MHFRRGAVQVSTAGSPWAGWTVGPDAGWWADTDEWARSETTLVGSADGILEERARGASRAVTG